MCESEKLEEKNIQPVSVVNKKWQTVDFLRLTLQGKKKAVVMELTSCAGNWQQCLNMTVNHYLNPPNRGSYIDQYCLFIILRARWQRQTHVYPVSSLESRVRSLPVSYSESGMIQTQTLTTNSTSELELGYLQISLLFSACQYRRSRRRVSLWSSPNEIWGDGGGESKWSSKRTSERRYRAAKRRMWKYCTSRKPWWWCGSEFMFYRCAT